MEGRRTSWGKPVGTSGDPVERVAGNQMGLSGERVGVSQSGRSDDPNPQETMARH